MPFSWPRKKGRKEKKKKPRGLYPLIKHSPALQAGMPGVAPCTIDLRPDTSAPTMGSRPPARFAQGWAGNQLLEEDRGHFKHWDLETANPIHTGLDT